jgi:hypothetical protein
MHQNLLLAAAMLPLVAPCTPVARAQAPDHLVGITRVSASLRHHDHATCTSTQCTPAGFPGAGNLPGGGTAWDPTTGGAWITNGTVLAKVDDACNYQCAPMPLPMIGNAVVTGLEVVESRRRLLMIDSAGFLHQFTLECPPQHLSSCQTGLGPVITMHVTSGLAVDEGLGLVFVSVSDYANNDSAIAVIELNNLCQVVQRVPIQGCPASTTPFGAFTGLAVDWCRRVIYATDGHRTMAIRYAPMAIPGIAVTGIHCCNAPVISVDPMVGLAVRPGRETTLGDSCANGVCPNCPMRHSLGNDPNVGNGAFRLDLTGAPAGSLAWDIIGVGACSLPGRNVRPLCGPVFIGQLLGALGPEPTGGVSGSVCGGDAAFRLPLPLLPDLCGMVVSSQCAVLCASLTGAIGTSLSNCISFELQGN